MNAKGAANGAGHMVGGLSSKELNWHTDQSYNQYPVTGCFLYAQVVPASGSRTSWASTSTPSTLANGAPR